MMKDTSSQHCGRQGRQSSFTPLSAKLQIPSSRHNTIPRPHLLRKLDEGLASPHKLILVCAPAGYGKTTLLLDWAAHCLRNHIAVAWISLDESDNDLQHFLGYVTANLKRLAPHAAWSPPSCLDASLFVEDVLIEMLNGVLAEIRNEFVLILDDYHLITNPAVHQSIKFVLSHLPPHMHVAISSRQAPPLSTGLMRARNQLTEVRASELGFTEEEARQFMAKTMGLELSAEDLQTWLLRTEGWAAGLQLAALSLRAPREGAASLDRIPGTHAYFVDYFAEQILEKQRPAMRRFLLQTSVLERLSAPLCEALTGDKRAQVALEELEKANLFLTGVDQEHHWYRYHSLFRGFLRATLQQVMPEQWDELNRRASDWCEQNGSIDDAITYALASHDYGRAAILIGQARNRAFHQSEISTLLGWMQQLPAEFVRAHPRLCVDQAWASAHAGFLDQSRIYIDAAQAALSKAKGPQAKLPAIPRYPGSNSRTVLEINVGLLFANFYRFRDISKAARYCRQALQAIAANDDMHLCVAHLLLGHVCLLQGAARAAEDYLLQGMEEGARAKHFAAYLSSANYLGQLHLLQGRLRESMTFFEGVSRYIRAQPEVVHGGVELIRLGDLQRERNDLAAAAKNIAAGLAAAEQGGDFVFLRDGLIAQGCLHQALGEMDRAFASFDKARRIAEHSQTRRETVPVEALLARLWIATGNLPAAEQWALAAAPRPKGKIEFLDEYSLITVARLLLAQGKASGARRLLRRLLPAARRAGRTGRLVEVQTLIAVSHLLLGEEAQAIAAMKAALALARPQNYVRTFVDEGQPVRDLIDCIHGSVDGDLADYTQMLLGAFHQDRISRSRARQGNPRGLLPEPLSEREVTLLKLIAAGMSNKEMAHNLVISIGTVKAHVHHVFRKLGVRSRTQAVAQAKELGLL